MKAKNDTLLQYAGFMVSLNKTSKLASMVLYKLRKIDLENKRAKRKNNFKSDPGLKDFVIPSKHYAKSGYDRGHLAPCEDLMSSQEKVDQSFYMSNIAPQLPGFNRGIWKKLEGQVREYAMENDSIIVITGPWQPHPDHARPELPVPGYYYKVIFDISPPDYKAVAFLMKNDTASGQVTEYAISVDSLEKYLGYDFFNLLDKELQDDIEADLDGWILDTRSWINRKTQNEKRKSKILFSPIARVCNALQDTGWNIEHDTSKNQITVIYCLNSNSYIFS